MWTSRRPGIGVKGGRREICDKIVMEMTSCAILLSIRDRIMRCRC